MEINGLSHEAQIDTQLAELHTAAAKQDQKLASVHAQLVTTLSKGMSYDERRFFAANSTLQQLINKAESMTEDGAPAYVLSSIDDAFETIRTIQAAQAEIFAQITELNGQYTGWSRFFLVNNNNGHIHSSMHCSTCQITTSFSWLPSVSGKTEADAVEEFGYILCSVCYPSAPVSWTDGISKVAQAERDAKAAEKAAKDSAKAEKAITAPDGSPLKDDSGYTIKTEVTARRELSSALQNRFWYDNDKYIAYGYRLADAIAAKTGELSHDIFTAAYVKAEKKVAKERRA